MFGALRAPPICRISLVSDSLVSDGENNPGTSQKLMSESHRHTPFIHILLRWSLAPRTRYEQGHGAAIRRQTRYAGTISVLRSSSTYDEMMYENNALKSSATMYVFRTRPSVSLTVLTAYFGHPLIWKVNYVCSVFSGRPCNDGDKMNFHEPKKNHLCKDLRRAVHLSGACLITCNVTEDALTNYLWA